MIKVEDEEAIISTESLDSDCSTAADQKRKSRFSFLRDTGPDSGWAWVVAFASFWVTMVSYGFYTGEGVLFVAFKDEYKFNRETTSWPFSVLSSALYLSSPVVAVMCNYLPLRLVSCLGTLMAILGVGLCYFAETILVLTLLFGVLQGVGYAFMTIPAVIMVNLYFERHRTTANSIQLAGGSLGATVFPLIIQAILSKIGLKNCFLFMAVVLMTSFFGALLFTPPKWLKKTEPLVDPGPISTDHVVFNKEENGLGNSQTCVNQERSLSMADVVKESDPNTLEENSSGATVSCLTKLKKLTLFVVLCQPMFWVIEVVGVFMGAGYQTSNEIFVDSAVERKISVVTGNKLGSVGAVVEFVGRIGTGWVTDLGFFSHSKFLQVLCFLIGVFWIAIPLFGSAFGFVVMMIYISFAGGIILPLLHVVQVKYLGLENLAATIGLDQFINGCISLLGPYIIGYFRDTVGSYDGFFYLLGAGFFLSSLVWFLEPLIMRKKKIPDLETAHIVKT